MTSVMLVTYPEVFAGGAIIAGLPYGAAANMQQAFETMYQCPPRAARAWGKLVRKVRASELLFRPNQKEGGYSRPYAL